MVHLVVPGPPVPMERARKGRNGWYLPRKSREYRERIQTEWAALGSKSLGNGPIGMRMHVHIGHSPTHLTRRGELRSRYVAMLPPGDTDNYQKAIADALTGLAYGDDKQITCWAPASKAWTRGEPRTEIWLWGLPLIESPAS